MNSWRNQILKKFTPGIARLTLVADPDGLLLEEGVYEAIQERGFVVLPYDDPVAFRFVYESRFRSRWERGEDKALVVVVPSGLGELHTLPYDLLKLGRKLSFSLGDLFPTLSYPVVATLDRSHLNALFEAQTRYAPGQLGETATKEFVLRHVFEVAPELIKQPSDLLRVLLRRHYRGQRVPDIMDEYFIEVLRRYGRFQDWPLEEIVPNREAFFAFLQERWPAFLDAQLVHEGGTAREAAPRYGLQFSGPTLLPFDHPDIRIYVDNLFLEGFLQPVEHAEADVLLNTPLAYGVQASPEESRRRRAEGLVESVEKTIPSLRARHGEWFQFAYRWAELVALVLHPDFNAPHLFREHLETLRTRIDSVFLEWVQEHYASLMNLPPAPPVMLHHVARYLTRRVADDGKAKIAFVIIDGLALDQWIAMRGVLADQNPALVFRESALFTWIPTITSVCRQAAFAGKPPLYFPGTIHTTDKEGSLWTQFWMDHGLARHDVAYIKGLGDGDLRDVADLLCRPKLRVVGLVVDKVDRIMHGMELGAAGMHNQIRQWTRQGFVGNLIRLLHDHGFDVYLASDHGNIEAKGVGRPAEGSIADVRGERARVYSDPGLRAQVKQRFPASLEWPAIGLPEDYLVLIAPPRGAFVKESRNIVGHGGISLEELIVPFVQVNGRFS